MLEGKLNLALIYPKSYGDSVFDGQIKYENSKAAFELILALSAEIDDKCGCMGYPKTSQLLKKLQGLAMLIFFPQI